MTIKIFRLLTGEDIISDTKESLSQPQDVVVLDNPASIIIQRSEDGQRVGVGIAPYAPLIEGDIILQKSSIVSSGTPDPKLEQEYRTRFGSGIVIPQMELQHAVK